MTPSIEMNSPAITFLRLILLCLVSGRIGEYRLCYQFRAGRLLFMITNGIEGTLPPRVVLSDVFSPYWNSVAFFGSIFHSRVYRYPVYFPGLSSIIRECLLKSTRIGSHVRDNKSNKDGSAIKHFLIVKLAAPIAKAADCGLAQSTTLAVCKIKAPLAGSRIVQT